jgi:hypothetical protein
MKDSVSLRLCSSQGRKTGRSQPRGARESHPWWLTVDEGFLLGLGAPLFMDPPMSSEGLREPKGIIQFSKVQSIDSGLPLLRNDWWIPGFSHLS